MSQHFKFIIPLLDKNITLDDLSYDAGFIDAFSADVNRPYLDHHIFLLYLAKTDTKEAYNRMTKFKSLPSLSNETEVTLKGKLCKLYAFYIVDKTIYKILDNILSFSNDNIERIMTFWKCTDEDINKYMVDPLHYSTYNLHNYINHVVPEQDYVKTCTRVHEKSQGL